MARIRTIKPSFFRHEELFEAEKLTGYPLRLIFAGLWTVADREGRFEWKPRKIKLDVLPYDDVDFAAALEALFIHGFIVKYTVGANTYAHIPSWGKHQQVNTREAQSELPSHDKSSASTCTHMPEQVQDQGEQEGKGREQEGKGNGRESREKNHSRVVWPEGAVVPDQWIKIAAQQRLMAGLPEIDMSVLAKMFSNHYAADVTNPRTMTEYQAKWNNWALKEKVNANGSGTGRKSQLEQLADIARGGLSRDDNG